MREKIKCLYDNWKMPGRELEIASHQAETRPWLDVREVINPDWMPSGLLTRFYVLSVKRGCI